MDKFKHYNVNDEYKEVFKRFDSKKEAIKFAKTLSAFAQVFEVKNKLVQGLFSKCEQIIETEIKFN